jgi:hypothetical protein
MSPLRVNLLLKCKVTRDEVLGEEVCSVSNQRYMRYSINLQYGSSDGVSNVPYTSAFL